ncbi:MAG: hypothetical protein QW727_01090 [Candidatus Pacearchaeota archaeon]
MSSSYDVLGNIIILKFPEGTNKKEKIKLARQLLSERKSVKTIVEKSDRIKGRLRTLKVKHLAGKKNLIADYVENGCRFKFNIETCYFSPRLSNERKEIAKQVKKNERVLVMFSGVAPFSVVIAKNSNAKEIYSVELGRECCKYAKENIALNKIDNKKIKIIQGDVKKIIPKLAKNKLRFDRIVMPRPNLKDNFLKEAFFVSKKNCFVNYYSFGRERDEIIKVIKNEALKFRKKVKILNVKKSGDIAPGKFRWRVDFKILN